MGSRGRVEEITHQFKEILFIRVKPLNILQYVSVLLPLRDCAQVVKTDFVNVETEKRRKARMIEARPLAQVTY